MSTALTRAVQSQLPANPLSTAQEVGRTLEALRTVANVLSPTIVIDHIPPMHKVSLGVCFLDSGPQSTDVYHTRQFMKDNERAPSKVGLLKLLQAAGGTVVSSERLDDRREPLYCEYQVWVELTQLDGRVVRVPGSKKIDLRAGSAQAAAMQDKQLAQQRADIDSLCESKALLRAIRGVLALAQKYTVADLQRPFVIPKLVPDLDVSDPAIRQLVAAKALGLEAQLYGPDKRRIQALPVETVMLPEASDDEPAQPAEPETVDDMPPPPAPEILVCECPCGHQVEISAATAAASIERVGARRCRTCYPGRSFDYEAHKHLATLGLPTFPKGTPDWARDVATKAAAAGGGR